jgi:hypothetical protein
VREIRWGLSPLICKWGHENRELICPHLQNCDLY